MLVGGVVVYKVMKKVGKLTEARMVPPEEPKYYPLVSDSLFENAVRGYKGVKGGTAAAAKIAARKKKLEEDELPMDKAPDPSLSNTNSPRRATKASVQVGGPFDLTASQKGKRQDEDKDWIGDAEDDIERRGTKGKCTPITKKGCTGKAKALAKTFKKMAKRKKTVKKEAAENPAVLKQRLEKERAKFKKERPLRPTGDDGRGGEPSPHSTMPVGNSGKQQDIEEKFEKRATPRGKVDKGTRKATASHLAKPNVPLTPNNAKKIANNQKAPVDAQMSGAEQM